MKTAIRIVLSLVVALPMFAATRWIGWEIPSRTSTNTHTSANGYRYCSSDKLIVAARMDGDEVTDLRLLDPVCSDDEVKSMTIEMQTKTVAASLDWLVAHVDKAHDPDELVTAIALHQDERVVPTLIPLARSNKNRSVRRQAIFWLGQKAGDKAAGELRRSVDEDPDADVRQHAVFAISQLPRERGVPILIDLVKTHKSAEVRKKAMFWLAQTDDPRAIDLIESILLP